MTATPRIVIVGGGFAGLWATRALAREAVGITLIDRANHHLFQPLLYQVATAGLSAPDIAAPLRHILRDQRNVRVLLGEVPGVDLAARTVRLADGTTLPYDQLLVASGATHAYFGHDHWAAHAPGLKTLDDALLIRRRVLLAFERAEAAADEAGREAWLHFAVVGGGPTGVELAGTLAEIARHTLRQEFRRIDPRRARVRLIEAGPAPLASFPPALQAKTRRQLERLGVDVVCGAPVADITAEGYRLGETFVPCRTVLWAAGVAASPLGRLLAAQSGVECDRAGRVKVRPDLSLPGHPEVFVAGDLAAVTQPDGRPVPGVAPAAKQMGRHVAAAMRARLRGAASAPFVYRDYGNLATIGRMAAVVDLRGLQFSGLPAWWFWLAAHVFFLIGFRNRLAVLMNWAWAYWTYQRHARIVIGGRAGAPPEEDQASSRSGAR
ncbi:MAG: NAD(P)/FAD-dependent oxidoreductase [Rubrivivax sp.]|nr:NAD(P)/FAD-dependent oxidoreductase [Rubrivivax sp.]